MSMYYNKFQGLYSSGYLPFSFILIHFIFSSFSLCWYTRRLELELRAKNKGRRTVHGLLHLFVPLAPLPSPKFFSFLTSLWLHPLGDWAGLITILCDCYYLNWPNINSISPFWLKGYWNIYSIIYFTKYNKIED